MPLLVRIARRMAVWERDDLQEIIETEFEPIPGKVDLQPSVYEVESVDFVVRAFTEHSASAGCDPPRSGGVVDLSDTSFIETPGTSRFAFTQQRHRELQFQDQAQLREFLSGILEKKEAWKYPIEKKTLLTYAKNRMTDEDPEWIAFCADYAPKSKKWGCPIDQP